jgi:hypothetical protein
VAVEVLVESVELIFEELVELEEDEFADIDVEVLVDESTVVFEDVDEEVLVEDVKRLSGGGTEPPTHIAPQVTLFVTAGPAADFM